MEIQNRMFAALDIAVSGLKAYGKQVELVGSNMANARTTDAGNGEPYRRLEATFKALDFEDEGTPGVELSDIIEDQSAFQKVLNPGHPNADENGYVAMPNVNYAQELINLNLATRAYEANAAMLKRYQAMVNSSLDLLK